MSWQINMGSVSIPVPHLEWKNQAVSTEFGLSNSMTLTCLLLTKSVRLEHYAVVLSSLTLVVGLQRSALQVACIAIQIHIEINTGRWVDSICPSPLQLNNSLKL